jgi:hypothetical protein
MGISSTSHQWQGKMINREVKELIGYSYGITNISNVELNRAIDYFHLNYQYIQLEFVERFNFNPVNPGEAYKLGLKVWEPHLKNGKFDYTDFVLIGTLKQFQNIFNLGDIKCDFIQV